MTRRKTENSGELFEFLMQRVDRRTDWGKIAEATLIKYKEAKNTSALSLIKSLVSELQTDNLAHILTLDDVYYKTNAEEWCICGKHLLKEVFLMNYKPGTLAQEQITSVISTGEPIKGTRDYIPIGSKCHERLPYILEDLGAPELLKRVKEGPKKQEKKLEEIILNLSPELKEKLEKYGIDAEQLEKVISLEHAQALIEGDESGIKFDFDLGKNRNTYNWFKEDIKAGDIQNEEVKHIWNKINQAAHLVTEEELATIMVYSHEFRQRNTDVLLAGVKEDLLFLSGLSKENTLIKKHGKVNIDKHYVLPETKYRSRIGLPKRTIRDVLNQEKITRVEAMGIHCHFPDIVERRIEINREIAQSYGVGRSWDYILKEIGPVFEKVKAELTPEYKKWGRIIEEHVLTKDEYLAVKGFFKRSSIGKESERENYLRNYNIEAFMEIAPKIAVIGRKLRYARKLEEKGSELSCYNILRQEYVLKEDLLNNFEKWTGIKGEADKVIDMIVNASFIENKNFLKFQKNLKEIHDNELVAKKYLKPIGEKKECILKKYYDILEKEGVRELDEITKEKLEKINEYMRLPFIKYGGVFLKIDFDLKNIRYAPNKTVKLIEDTYSNFEKLLLEAHFSEKTDLEKFNENLKILKGDVVYIDEGIGDSFLGIEIYNADWMKVKNAPHGFSAYNIERVEEAADKINSAVEISNVFLKRLEKLKNMDYLNESINEWVDYVYYIEKRMGNKFFVSKEFKEKVERAYEELKNK